MPSTKLPQSPGHLISDEVDTYIGLLDDHHYLKCPHARKPHLSQVVCYEGKAVALLIWTTSSRKLVHRDEHIGRDSRIREKRNKVESEGRIYVLRLPPIFNLLHVIFKLPTRLP